MLRIGFLVLMIAVTPFSSSRSMISPLSPSFSGVEGGVVVWGHEKCSPGPTVLSHSSVRVRGFWVSGHMSRAWRAVPQPSIFGLVGSMLQEEAPGPHGFGAIAARTFSGSWRHRRESEIRSARCRVRRPGLVENHFVVLRAL